MSVCDCTPRLLPPSSICRSDEDGEKAVAEAVVVAEEEADCWCAKGEMTVGEDTVPCDPPWDPRPDSVRLSTVLLK